MPLHPNFAVEPHYHDRDEFWLLIEGDLEGWMDDRVYKYTADTAVYNPMGVIHRHQSFTPGLSSGLLTRLERQKRPAHLQTGSTRAKRLLASHRGARCRLETVSHRQRPG